MDFLIYRRGCETVAREHYKCQYERLSTLRSIKESRDFYCREVHRLRKPDERRSRLDRCEKRAMIKIVTADHERETKELKALEQTQAIDIAVHAADVDEFRRASAESMALFKCMEIMHMGLHGDQRSAQTSRWLTVDERRKLAYSRNEVCRRQHSALNYDIQLVF